VQYPRFHGLDVNLIRAILYTLSNDGRIRSRVLNWLRCEYLSPHDRGLLGGLVPRPQPEMPFKTIQGLGQLMHAVHTAAIVPLVDQIDQMIDIDKSTPQHGEQYRFAVNALVDIADGLPTAVVVTGGLEDLYQTVRQALPKTHLVQLESDPAPIRLAAKRSVTEVEAMAARRLTVLFEAAGIEPDPTNPVAPYAPADLAPRQSLRGRDVLDNLRGHREQCFAAKRWVPPTWKNEQGIVEKSVWEQRWNDFLTAYKAAVVDAEPKLAELLAFGVRAVSGEMTDGVHFSADPDGRFVAVEAHPGGNAIDPLLVEVCDRSTRRAGALTPL
jgi:hypothetical protein